MFGDRNANDPLDDIAHFERERRLAREQWPFLTQHDLRGIKTVKQLAAMVHARTNLSVVAADAEVEAWLEGHDVRVARAKV
ncbi:MULTISPECIES: hypothetical protein [unclassified Devosia]|uniref:hypothetical protein n=1 Tax=unclassified Devosia TaxID=196773 RepID=UPI0025E93823|nr:hypothetical protein [Devosia sp.]MCR6636880.1 hypothetical protein [Devosia sp.]